uniref:Uncharacterized protein n=1 Tax=Picea sitchensis TaxID=3332 RepID=A9NMA4_PICSI|nr:unknown [Picea sitchensis]
MELGLPVSIDPIIHQQCSASIHITFLQERNFQQRLNLLDLKVQA